MGDALTRPRRLLPLRKCSEAAFHSGNLNLNLLTGYRLLREWDAEACVMTVISGEANLPEAERFLDELFDLARLPDRVGNKVLVGSFEECLVSAPIADVNVVGLPANPKRERLLEIGELSRSTVIFVWDSGRESALM